MKDKKYFVLGIILAVVLSLTIVSAVYTRSVPAYTQYPSFVPTGGEFQTFDRSMCEAGQDFLLQVSPFGCTPSVIRSDLLEEQNVPVFCPISATQLNPLIDIESIDYMTFSGQFPQEVSGVAYHPARAALGNMGRGVQTDAPILDNLGYAVIVLKRQGNESAMPDFVEGNLTANLRYDIKNAFGVGQASYYLPELEDEDWDERYTQYSFWNGKGYLRAEGIDEDRATISIYSDREMSSSGRLDTGKRKISTANLNIGETSGEIFMPGFDYCMGSMQIKLNDLENPDTRARIIVDSEVVEVKDGERFLENRCRVREIEKQGIVQKVTITCEDDDGRDTFSLVVTPKIKLRIDGSEGEYSVGDWLYRTPDTGRSVYLGFVGTRDNSNSKESLYVRFMTLPKSDARLTDSEISAVAAYDRAVRGSQFDTGLLGKGIGLSKNIGSRIASGFRRVIQGRSMDYLPAGEARTIFEKEVVIIDFAGAKDSDISGDVKEYYGDAVEDYETILDSFAGERYEEIDTRTLGEMALLEEIQLAWKIEQKSTVVELCDNFREKYPSFPEPEECNQAYKLSSRTSTIRDVSINGKISSLSFDGIYEPSFEEYGIKLIVEYPGGEEILGFEMVNNEIIYLNDTTDEFIQLVDLDKNSAKIKTNLRAEGVFEAVKTTVIEIPTKKLEKGRRDSLGSNYFFTLDSINLKKSAKVSVIPNINYAQTKADFNFKIGIEKRGIQLSPEQTSEKIDSLNNTLTTWRDRSEKLGNVVSGFKKACLGTGAALTVKNFLANLGGKGIARQKVMRGESGWVENCETRVSNGEYRNVDSCLLDNSDEINSAVDIYSNLMDAQNEDVEGLQKSCKTDDGFLGEDVIDTDCLMKDFVDTEYKDELSSNLAGLGSVSVGNDQVPVSDIIVRINENTTFLTQARNLQLNSRLLDSDDDYVKEMAIAQIEADLRDIYLNVDEEILEQSFTERLGESLSGIDVDIYSREDSIEGGYNGWKTPSSGIGQIPGEVSARAIIYNGEEYILQLQRAGDKYRVLKVYDISGGEIVSTEADEIKSKFSFRLFDEASYKNEYSNPEIRYYETEPYKGLPAIVPFDVNNGWYAAVKSTLPIGGAIKSYDDSGRVSSFYLCNVGTNEREEFNSGIGDDVCEMINLGTGQPYNQFPGLDGGKASRLVTRAVSAIEDASRAYRSGVDRVRVDGKSISVGTPYANIPDIQCQDFMSPSDCNLLFNVCDPVVCPSSRCDLDGNYPVQDVVQSGIVGSIALCMPNFPEVKVPICLSGVHAGVEGYLSVLDSYQQCLQTSLDTGQTVGICDEIYSIHMCEFFWRQSIPLAKAAIPKLLGSALGQNVRGGGEYLGVQNAFDSAGQSFDYFTQYYAANSYQAFKARSAEGVGGEVCKNFVSVINPQGGNLLDALTEPDVPAQFYGRFDEIPFTTATNPPISQYKVFYHIYAGKDVPAYYEVYLRDPSGSSFYQDTSFRRVVAKGFIAVGDYATETRDFTSPAGYKQLCIIVNGREECGFKQVTTDFAVNYLSDQYVAEQASQTDIKSETQCVSGSSSAYSFLNPNIQAGAEEVLNPAIYNRGIIRICATDNPGRNSDALAGEGDARWRDVGYCGDAKLRCWLDTESVKDVVRITSIEDDILGEVEDDYLERLREEGDYLTDEGFETLVQEIDELETNHLGIIEKVDENILKTFLNNQRAYLHLQRGNAYMNLAVQLFQKIKPSEPGEPTTEPGEGFKCEEAENSIASVEDGSSIVRVDRCKDGNTVEEYYCLDDADEEPYYSSNTYDCPNGCSEAVCLEAECEDCGKGALNLCDGAECLSIDNGRGIRCIYENKFFPIPNTCATPEGSGVPETTIGECGSISDCQKLLGNRIIELARAKERTGMDADVRADTGAASFECLVLQVAYTESDILHCKYEDGEDNPLYDGRDPLYCEGDIDELISGDGGSSLGVMEINKDVHGEKLLFEENVNYGIDLLINNHASASREYVCNGKTYRGWTRALRSYNGWPETDNIDCSKGNTNYVEVVIGFKDEVATLFPEC